MYLIFRHAWPGVQMAQGDSKGERKKARQVLQQAAEESVRRVPAPASAPLWMQLFQALQALNLPCLPLANILSSQLMGLSKAPPEVGCLVLACIVYFGGGKSFDGSASAFSSAAGSQPALPASCHRLGVEPVWSGSVNVNGAVHLVSLTTAHEPMHKLQISFVAMP